MTVNNLFAHWLKEVDIKDMAMICKICLWEIRLKYVDIPMQCLNICLKEH